MLFSSYTFLSQFLPATALAFAAARRHSPRAGIMVRESQTSTELEVRTSLIAPSRRSRS